MNQYMVVFPDHPDSTYEFSAESDEAARAAFAVDYPLAWPDRPDYTMYRLEEV